MRLGQGQQSLQRRLIAAVNPLLAALFVDFYIGLRTRTMVIEIGVEVGAVELLQALGMCRIDRTVTQVLADHGTILGFDQAVVVALSRPAFGLFDQQSLQHTGYHSVDELTAVIRMKAEDAEGKLS